MLTDNEEKITFFNITFLLENIRVIVTIVIRIRKFIISYVTWAFSSFNFL